jgi:pyridoxamine 5'-phosphate oxidase
MSVPSELLPPDLPANPLGVVIRWLDDAVSLRAQPNPNSMVLATVAPDSAPSARVVLCKAIVPEPGYVVFYTNYRSRKGRELEANASAAAVMHWDHLHRQVRVEGLVARSPAAESDAYFETRPWPSRLGAWASAQSEPVASRRALAEALETAARRFGTPRPDENSESLQPPPVIPRPPHWGGYRLYARAVELWVEGQARIHDRARWTRELALAEDGTCQAGSWTVTRLQP